MNFDPKRSTVLLPFGAFPNGVTQGSHAVPEALEVALFSGVCTLYILSCYVYVTCGGDMLDLNFTQ